MPAMIVPLVLILLKKFMGDKNLDANSLSSLLSAQGPNPQGALGGRLTNALAFASPAASLGGLGGQAANTVQRAGAAMAGGAAVAATTAKLGLMRWLPRLIGAAVLLLLWNLFSGKSTPPPSPAPTVSALAPMTTLAAPAAPIGMALTTKIYFDVGAARGDAEARRVRIGKL